VTTQTVETERSDNPDTDWCVGYGLALPCQWKEPVPCEREAEWFANQHGCIRAELCEEHLFFAYRDVAQRIAEWGSVRCRRCKQDFATPDAFIKAVRI
jgi:hypothetical protein